MENLHELLKEMLNKANLEVLQETGKLKTDPEPVVKKAEPVLTETKKDGDDIKHVEAAHRNTAIRLKRHGLDSDAKDHEKIANFIKTKKHKEAKELYQKLDTVSREELAGGNKNEKNAAYKYHGLKLDEEKEHGPDEDEDNLDRQARKERIKDIKAKAKAKLADKKPVNETNVDDPTVEVDTTAVSQIDDSDQKLAKKNWRKYFPRPSNKIKDDAEMKAVLAGKPIRETEEIIENDVPGKEYKVKNKKDSMELHNLRGARKTTEKILQKRKEKSKK